jgi:hypothetical protein
LRAAFHEAFGSLQPEQIAEQSDRMDMMLAVPELRAAILEQFAAAWRLLCGLFAERSGRSSNDIAVQTLAGAVVGAAMAVMFAMMDDPQASLAALMDEAMERLESGLTL